VGATATTFADAVPTPVLAFSDASFVYAGVGRQVEALSGLTFSVAPGESVAVIGPSGCGKSTMLLLAAGLLRPTHGGVQAHGAEVSAPSLGTALILQEHGLLPWKTVEDNAGLGLLIRGASRKHAREQVREALVHLGLGDFVRAYPGELSGGMRQRVGLARAVALNAGLLLMDEPLSALDALTREDVQNTLLKLWIQRGHAQVLVTHSIEEAVFLGRRIIVMSARPGSVCAVVENPDMGEPGYRQSPTFFEACGRLRVLLAAARRHLAEGQQPAGSQQPAEQGAVS